MGMGGVGGAGSSKGTNDSGGVGSAQESTAANTNDSKSVDAAMSEVSDAEVAGAASSVTESVDGYDAAATEAKAEKAKEQQAAEICIGTQSECEQEAADKLTDDEAVKALDGGFFHDPRDLTASQVKGLEALSKAHHLSERTKEAIRGFLEDHRNYTDSLGINGLMGRPDAPRAIPSDSGVI